jgi:hypothetical protein
MPVRFAVGLAMTSADIRRINGDVVISLSQVLTASQLPAVGVHHAISASNS